ncbi:mechanosensitive ion channel family protein [Candidatus Nitrotoga sp. M5]|uniref:mechanosensitive ion channel family protein n=1 Tax=Candidatus Nitrotoga sp. M5 TaxID=2890409 RepID=UPI001EF3CD50|nr:mechanosensitive ion channel family protein [Candidatus Nitrotoga sp. M5]CAH1386953.1 Mechanosensitive ion channel protein MscS [Candidatus Nitrotoga sp. M5]
MKPFNVIMESLRKMGENFLSHLPQIVFGCILLLITWGVGRAADLILRRVLPRFRLRTSLQELFRQLSYIGIWIVGILASAIVMFPSLTPGKVLTAIGLGSIAIGFAFKDIFENFIAGMLILLREPFQLNDFIECDEIEGFVEDITIRDTHIRQTDGQRVVVPNAKLFKSPVTVRTDLDKRRVTIMCGVAYGEDVDNARSVIVNAVQGLDTVDKEKDVQVFAQAFGSSSIDFEITWWTGSKPVDVRQSRDKVVAAVKKALDNAGIEIPFPYRTLTFKEPLKTVIERAGQQEKSVDSQQGI